MKGPSLQTTTTTWKTCKQCEFLLAKDIRSERFPKLNRIVNYCKHPDISQENGGEAGVSFICKGKTIKTPMWCYAKR